MVAFHDADEDVVRVRSDMFRRITQGTDEYSRIPKRLWKRKFEELIKNEKFKKSLAEGLPAIARAGILILLGDRGVGKTQLAVEIMRMCVANGITSKYYRCREIGMKMREVYGADSKKTESAAMEEFVRPWLLVIDECQEKADKDWEQRTLTLLLDKRYSEMRPTILIANCDEKNFLDLMGPSIFDRHHEGGALVFMEGTTLRKNIYKDK